MARFHLTAPPADIVALEVVADVTATSRCDEGFAQVRRRRLRNRYADGQTSREYPCDAVERPPTYDAVAVLAFDRAGTAGGPRVLLRRCLRPVVYLRPPPVGEALPEPRFFLWETVAGVLEPDDLGEPGLRHRAAEELREEAGLVVDAATVLRLGAAVFPSPGVLSEMIHLLAVETPLDARHPTPHGDGSPMEERAVVTTCDLEEALAACQQGHIRDAKTELLLHRLSRHLG